MKSFESRTSADGKEYEYVDISLGRRGVAMSPAHASRLPPSPLSLEIFYYQIDYYH